MAKFIIRIELHSTSDRANEALITEMEKEGFTDFIRGDDGVAYQLPSGEFYKEGNYSLSEVFDAAQRAASATGKGNWILVTESYGITLKLGKVTKPH